MIWSLLACVTAPVYQVTLSSTTTTGDTAATVDAPDLLWIVVDNLRADAWPDELDGWAQNATVWPIAHAAYTQSYGGNASMMTGQHAPTHGATGPSVPLPESAHTWAEHLSSEGYDTRAVSASPVLTEARGFHQGFASWELLPGEQPDAEDVTAAALATWDDMTSPRYLRVHYQDPHAPLAAPGATDTADRAELDSYDDLSEPTDDDLDRIHAAYAAEVAYAGEAIASLLDSVGCDVVVVITSDHGESFGDGGEWGHNDLYRETTEVPLAIAVPGREGRERTDQPSVIDILPTLANVLGIPESSGWQGRDLFCDPILSHSYTAYASGAAVVSSDGRWRYIRRGGAELYDREADPDETVDVSASHADVVAELNAFRLAVEAL